MSDFERFKTICRDRLMEVETALVKTYTTQIRGRGDYVAVDGGAHTGYHCSRIAGFEECARVYAIEADPHTSLRLQERMAALDDARRLKIRIVEKALQEDQHVDHVTWMSSESHPGRSGVSSIWQNDDAVSFRAETRVPATTIDRLLAGQDGPRCALIKLDLEGGDFMAILGALNTLRRDRPLLVFENSVRAPEIYGYDVAQVAAFFEAVGYVPVGFDGEVATPKTWFRFWEMWAAPREEAAALQARLKAVVGNAVAAHAT